MNSKKVITLLSAFALSFTLFACGNNQTTTQPKDKEESKVTEEVKDDAKKDEKVEDKDSNKDLKDEKKAEGSENSKNDSTIHNLKYAYLPENFVENYKDEKNDLITVEYGAEKNPAKKITLQVSDNKERFDTLYKKPEDAEDIEVGSEKGKFRDDGSFKYLVVERDGYWVYARSTLDKDETIKVVENIK